MQQHGLIKIIRYLLGPQIKYKKEFQGQIPKSPNPNIDKSQKYFHEITKSKNKVWPVSIVCAELTTISASPLGAVLFLIVGLATAGFIPIPRIWLNDDTLATSANVMVWLADVVAAVVVDIWVGVTTTLLIETSIPVKSLIFLVNPFLLRSIESSPAFKKISIK